MRDEEPHTLPESPMSTPDNAQDIPDDGTLHVSSLRPASRAFSLRRLLNLASLVVAMALVVALAIAWLPGVLSQGLDSRSAQNNQLTSDKVSAARGTGWQSIGPTWAQDIAFDSYGIIGYVCGAIGPGNTPVLVSRFDTSIARTNTWQIFTIPATGNHCQIAVSPVDANDVALSIDDCPIPNGGSCSNGSPTSRIYRSYDGGASWSKVPLLAPVAVNGLAWTNSALFLRVWGQMEDGHATTAPNSQVKASAHLLVSRDNGPFTEIGAKLLVGKAAQFDYLALFSSGTTLFVAVNSTPCSDYCLTVAHTNDSGEHWTEHSAIYAGRPITPASAQPEKPVLVGWVIRQADQTMALLRSFDYGEHWLLLPELPTNPSTGGVTVFATPDGTIYAASYGNASVVYELPEGASTWKAVAPMPTGMPLAVQHNAAGQAVALWGQAREWFIGSASPGLEYFPLTNAAS